MTTHGHTRVSLANRMSPTYSSWRHMIQRCSNPNYHSYHRYGGRDIGVCISWARFDSFLADMGERPEGTTLHRINSDDDYAPSNCVWASSAEQFSLWGDHCKNGHPLSGEHLYVLPDGRRQCRTCSRNRKRQRRAAGKRD